MKQSEKQEEIMKQLTLLTTKSNSIEAVLVERVDKSALDDMTAKLASLEDSMVKLTHSSADLKKQCGK